MKNLLADVVVASLLVVSVAGQGQQPAAPGEAPAALGRQPQEQQPATAQLGKVMISGCIQSAPPASPTGTAPSTPDAPRFDLANATIVAGAPVGTTGTGATATRYRLEGDDKTISPHLNHQVEITGTVSRAAATGAGAAAAPMLKVDSLKMVASKCQ